MSARDHECLTCGGPVHTTTASGDTFCVPCSSATWLRPRGRSIGSKPSVEALTR